MARWTARPLGTPLDGFTEAGVIFVVVGTQLETETLFDVVPVKPIFKAVGFLTETETLFEAVALKPNVTAVRFASETELARVVVVGLAQTISIGFSSETEVSQAVPPLKPIITVVGFVDETEALYDVSWIHHVNTVTETETLFDAVPVKPIITAVGFLTETEALFDVTSRIKQTISVSVITESETLFGIFVEAPRFIAVSTVYEAEVLFSVGFVSGEHVVQVSTLQEAETLFRVSIPSLTFNRFVINPHNNSALNSVVLTLPAVVQFDGAGAPIVRFRGWFFGTGIASAEDLRASLLEIVLDRQIVDIFYPPDNSVSGFYYINDVKLEAVSIASGLYRYDLDCEKTLVGSG